MTHNNALKKKAREHAARTGVPYAQARREVMAQHQGGGAAEPKTDRWVQIQQAVRDDASTPLPFTFDPHGYVGNQDFWRGEPWRLIGFVANPDEHVIDVQREDFLAEPQQVIGMHPVLMDRKDRSWSTWRGAIERVETKDKPAIDPDLVFARFSLMVPDGSWTTIIGVAHLLHCLSRVDIAKMRATGGERGQAAEDLLSLLCMTGHDRALELSSHMDDVEDEDIALTAHLDVEDDEAWAAARSGRR